MTSQLEEENEQEQSRQIILSPEASIFSTLTSINTLPKTPSSGQLRRSLGLLWKSNPDPVKEISNRLRTSGQLMGYSVDLLTSASSLAKLKLRQTMPKDDYDNLTSIINQLATLLASASSLSAKASTRLSETSFSLPPKNSTSPETTLKQTNDSESHGEVKLLIRSKTGGLFVKGQRTDLLTSNSTSSTKRQTTVSATENAAITKSVTGELPKNPSQNTDTESGTPSSDDPQAKS